MSGGAGEHTPVPADVVERMVALVRSIADAYKGDRPLRGYLLEGDEARAIAALLPPPVDLDLIEARWIVANAVAYGLACPGDPQLPRTQAFLNGDCDQGRLVTRTLAAIKRGRELERGA